MPHYALRFTLPDRPGSLGAVATELGRLDANITWLRVIETADGTAVDEIHVDVAARQASRLPAAVESVDSAVVEHVRPAPPDIEQFTALELSAELVQTPPDRALTTFINLLPAVTGAPWAIAIGTGDGHPDRLAASHGAPRTTPGDVPWLPLHGPRRITDEPWTAQWLADHDTIEFAAAPLLADNQAVIVARPNGPRFRSHELQQLGLLTSICGLRIRDRRTSMALLQP